VSDTLIKKCLHDFEATYSLLGVTLGSHRNPVLPRRSSAKPAGNYVQRADTDLLPSVGTNLHQPGQPGPFAKRPDSSPHLAIPSYVAQHRELTGP
jgi:hypothetical protein